MPQPSVVAAPSNADHDERIAWIRRQLSVEQFLFHEARLLDERRFEEWEALWTDDGVYWVPAQDDDYDPNTRVSIIFDDRETLAKRVRRLAGPDSHAEQPPPRTRRVISNVEIANGDDPGTLVVESNFVVVSYRREHQDTWAGRTTHHLRVAGDQHEISFKKVVLVNCDSFLTHLPFLP